MAHIMDKEHFYKVDGEFILFANDVCKAVSENNVFGLMLASAKLYEKFKTLRLEEI